MTDQQQLYVDPGHRVPDDEWGDVVRRAREVREETQAGAGGGAGGPGGIIVDLTARGVASGKFFPVSGIPTQLLVLHSAECPLQAGYAVSLSEWFSSTVYPAAPIASWQRFVDPVYRVRAMPDELGAWHASEANVLSIGWEQAGYARFSTAEWLTPDGRAQLELLAFDMAEVAIRDGIPPRWLSYEEVRAVLDGGNRSIKGFCFHRQIDPETRTDPGDGYPSALLMERITFYMNGGNPPQPEPAAPVEIPKEWDEMATRDEVKAAAAEAIREVLDDPAVIDKIALAVLKRDCYLVDPSGETGEIVGTTSLAKKVNWMAHNDAQILKAIVGSGRKST